MSSPHVTDIDTAGFASRVVERSMEVPVVVDFWAAWCGPCKVLGPILEKLADESAGAFELAKVDVDANQALAGQFGVQGIPTVVGFRDGQPVSQFTGALPEAQVREWIRQLVPSEHDLLATAADELLAAGNVAGAEEGFRRVLVSDPAHADAATGLATLLIDSERFEEALTVLEPVPADQEVDRLRAAARVGTIDTDAIPELETKLKADPANVPVRIELGKALAADNRYEHALETLLQAVVEGGETRDQARTAMLDVFEVLGPEHQLTTTYRRRLASALF